MSKLSLSQELWKLNIRKMLNYLFETPPHTHAHVHTHTHTPMCGIFVDSTENSHAEQKTEDTIFMSLTEH